MMMFPWFSIGKWWQMMALCRYDGSAEGHAGRAASERRRRSATEHLSPALGLRAQLHLSRRSERRTSGPCCRCCARAEAQISQPLWFVHPPSYLRSALPYVRLWSAFYISGLHMIYGLNCLHCCCCSWMSPVRQQHQVWHIILNAEFIICNAEIIISFKCRSHHALSICDKPDHTPSTAACHCRPFPRAHAVACSQSFSLLAWCHVRMTSSTKSSPSTSPAATRCDFILRNDEFCI